MGVESISDWDCGREGPVIYVQSAGEDERKNGKMRKNGGMCRERSNFLGELAEYLMEAEWLSQTCEREFVCVMTHYTQEQSICRYRKMKKQVAAGNVKYDFFELNNTDTYK